MAARISDSTDCISRIASAMSRRPGSYVFLTGAGVSLSAGIPLWESIRNDMLSELYDLPHLEAEALFRKAFGEQVRDGLLQLQSDKTTLPAEAVAEVFEEHYGAARLAWFLARRFEVPGASVTYHALCTLIQRGMIRWYLTFNQDSLMERNLEHAGVSRLGYRVLSRHADFADFEQDPTTLTVGTPELVIANLHGVYHLPNSLAVTVKDACRPLVSGSPKEQLISTALSSAEGVVIVGYRALDLDCWPLIRKLVEEHHAESLYWVSPGEHPPEKAITLLGPDNERHLRMTSDLFFAAIANASDHGHLPVAPTTQLQTRSRDSSRELSNSATVSSPGSVVLGGEYGVYMTRTGTGSMLQLVSPLRCQVSVTIQDAWTGDADDSYICESWSPEFSRWMNYSEAEKAARSVVGGFRRLANKPPEPPSTPWNRSQTADKRFAGLLAECATDSSPGAESILSALSILATHNILIRVRSEFPGGVGLGENMPATILGAIYSAVLRAHGQTLESGRLSSALGDSNWAHLLRVTGAYHWAFDYQDTSYLLAMPPFCEYASDEPILLMNRLAAERHKSASGPFDFFDRDEYLALNRDLNLQRILETLVSKPFANSSVDFAIAYAPRTLVDENPLKATTAVAMSEVRKRGRETVGALALVTERMEEELRTMQWAHVGKLMTSAHFLLAALGRGNPATNELVGRLSTLPGVLGAKTSGTGPAGGMVILYDRFAVDLYRLRRTLTDCGYYLLVDSVWRGQDLSTPLVLQQDAEAGAPSHRR